MLAALSIVIIIFIIITPSLLMNVCHHSLPSWATLPGASNYSHLFILLFEIFSGPALLSNKVPTSLISNLCYLDTNDLIVLQAASTPAGGCFPGSQSVLTRDLYTLTQDRVSSCNGWPPTSCSILQTLLILPPTAKHSPSRKSPPWALWATQSDVVCSTQC